VGLVGTAEVWVTANFKETQVAEMKPGQEVEVEVDGVPGTFVGHVQGLSGATGARFSLLPPDNASGNFTKVVQRVPVHIELGADALGAVRPGQSANVTVHVK
jgi:membrane fusion protein (multidrug efflux system)